MRLLGQRGEDEGMACKSHCYYKEEKIQGEGGCFLGLPGPMEVCQGYQPPTVVGPAPLDPEMKKLFKGIDHG